MTRQRKRLLKLDQTNVVGVVDSLSAWKLAMQIEPWALDGIELRLDCLEKVPPKTALRELKLPWIATVRDAAEGGSRSLDTEDRRRLFDQAIPIADAVDLELAQVKKEAGVAAAVRSAGVPLILSVHDFSNGLSLSKLRDLAVQAGDAGADVFKVAVTPTNLSQIAALIELLDGAPLPVAAMAMGPFGRPSRLLLAACGSVLNYGWIEKPVVSGQWEAVELRRQLDVNLEED